MARRDAAFRVGIILDGVMIEEVSARRAVLDIPARGCASNLTYSAYNLIPSVIGR